MRKLYLSCGVAALMAGVCLAAEGSGSGSGGGMDDKIRAALSRLDTKKDDDWTAGGLPSMERMKELTGSTDLTRAEVAAVSPGFSREKQEGADTGGKPGAPSGNHKDVAERDKLGEPDGTKSPAEISQERADPNVPPGDAAANQTTSFYPEITAGGGGQPGEDDGPLIAGGDQKRSGPTAAEIAERVDDPIVLIEAFVMVASGERFRRNNPLMNLVRAYQVEQDAIKTLQGRLDARDADRKKQNAEAERAETRRADKA